MKRHSTTTLFGWVAAAGTILATIGAALNHEVLTLLGAALAATGQGALGHSAADADKVVPKPGS